MDTHYYEATSCRACISIFTFIPISNVAEISKIDNLSSSCSQCKCGSSSCNETMGDSKESCNIAFKKAMRISSFPLVPNNC